MTKTALIEKFITRRGEWAGQPTIRAIVFQELDGGKSILDIFEIRMEGNWAKWMARMIDGHAAAITRPLGFFAGNVKRSETVLERLAGFIPFNE